MNRNNPLAAKVSSRCGQTRPGFDHFRKIINVAKYKQIFYKSQVRILALGLKPFEFSFPSSVK
jgi:hypothetical protein